MQDARPERRKIVDNRVPHSFDIHPVIAMPEPVADAADIVPRQAGAQSLRIFSKPASLMSRSLRSTAATVFGSPLNASKFIPRTN